LIIFPARKNLHDKICGFKQLNELLMPLDKINVMIEYSFSKNLWLGAPFYEHVVGHLLEVYGSHFL